MALFVPGMSCAICGKPMLVASDTVALPAFVANRADPLFVFSDAIMHSTCFAKHPMSSEAQRWNSEARSHTKPSERVCAVCGNLIANPDDYFGTGLLTRDPANPLFVFNFTHLHRSHANRWSGLEHLRAGMGAAESSGEWRGPRLLVGDATLQWGKSSA